MESCVSEALGWAQAGLKRFPKDADLLLAAGTASEILTWSSVVPRFRADLPRDRQTHALTARADRHRLAQQAARFFAEAIAVAPDLHEARLRYGRVLFRLGQVEAARGSLLAVLERSQDSGLRYLAHLFLAHLSEQAGRLDDAESEYRAALALSPRAQVAAVGLSHVRLLGGDAAGAGEVLRRALDHAPRRGGGEPYWIYATGRAALAETLLDQLRQEAAQ